MIHVPALRTVRERGLLTQRDLAQRAGITQAAISRIECGHTEPHLRTIRKLADALAVDPADLMAAHPAPDTTGDRR
jgi:transcriptional regulator with XRE-family HTH domain